jgi:hypothetical protein
VWSRIELAFAAELAALLRLAEAHAAANGATGIPIEASLAGASFYRANGYVEANRGETRLMAGYPISCVSCARKRERCAERARLTHAKAILLSALRAWPAGVGR